MTEKRIRKVAAKMYRAFLREYSMPDNAHSFETASESTQRAWVFAALIAVAELKGGKPKRKVQNVK